MNVQTKLDDARKMLKDRVLQRGYALLGYFSKDKKTGIVPLHDLACCCLLLLTEPRKYIGWSQSPAMLAEVPAFYAEDAVCIGGPGWFIHHPNGQKAYTRERQALGENGRICNTKRSDRLKDVWEDDMKRDSFALNPTRSDDARTIAFLHTMLADERHRRTDGITSSDKAVSVPSFYCQKPGNSYLRLREGPELLTRVQTCAETGEWGVLSSANMTASGRGVVKNLGKELELRVEFKTDHDAADLLQCERQGHRVVRTAEHIAVFFKIEDPTAEIELEIFNIFGVNRGLEFMPVVGAGKSLRVCAGQTLWVPVPRGRYSVEELQKRDDFEALCYLAALQTKDDETGFGGYYDLAFVHPADSEQVFADLGSIPTISKIRLTSSSGNYIPDVVLSSRGADHVANFSLTTSRDEINKAKEQRLVEKARRQRDEEERKRKPAVPEAVRQAEFALKQEVMEALKEAVQPPVEQPQDSSVGVLAEPAAQGSAGGHAE